MSVISNSRQPCRVVLLFSPTVEKKPAQVSGWSVITHTLAEGGYYKSCRLLSNTPPSACWLKITALSFSSKLQVAKVVWALLGGSSDLGWAPSRVCQQLRFDCMALLVRVSCLSGGAPWSCLPLVGWAVRVLLVEAWVQEQEWIHARHPFGHILLVKANHTANPGARIRRTDFIS